MAKITLYNMKGEKKGFMALPSLFETKPRPDLVSAAVRWQELKSKRPVADTKTRGERRGGGAKPWRQKGTGRARVGSIRSPLWRKGGIVFGPTSERSYAIRMPKKQRRLAIKGILSDKVRENKLIVLDKLEMPEIGTKKFEEILTKLPIEGTVLLTLVKKDEKIEKSARNLAYLKILPAHSLNIIDLLKYEYLLMPKEAIEVIEKRYSLNKKSNLYQSEAK